MQNVIVNPNSSKWAKTRFSIVYKIDRAVYGQHKSQIVILLDKHCINCHNQKCIKFLTRLGFDLSKLHENKFKHSFQDLLNPSAIIVSIANKCDTSFFSVPYMSLHKKRSFPFLISSVNVTKSAVPCGFGQIYWRNP